MEYTYNTQIEAYNVSFTHEGVDYTAIYNAVEGSIDEAMVQGQIDLYFAGETSGLTSVVEVVTPADPVPMSAEEQAIWDEYNTLTESLSAYKVEKDKLSKEMVELGEYILAMKQMELDLTVNALALYENNKTEYERLAGLFNTALANYKSTLVTLQQFQIDNPLVGTLY